MFSPADNRARFDKATRKQIATRAYPVLTDSEMAEVEADHYVQWRLHQLRRADQKVREIKTNFNTYFDYFDAFCTFPEMHFRERREKAMEELAIKPRQRVYAALMKEVEFAIQRVRSEQAKREQAA